MIRVVDVRRIPEVIHLALSEGQRCHYVPKGEWLTVTVGHQKIEVHGPTYFLGIHVAAGEVEVLVMRNPWVEEVKA